MTTHEIDKYNEIIRLLKWMKRQLSPERLSSIVWPQGNLLRQATEFFKDIDLVTRTKEELGVTMGKGEVSNGDSYIIVSYYY
jgi:hypothetical protein